MAQGNRPDRVAEELRHVISGALSGEVKDPGIGFITVTHVKVSPDLQVARVSYTIIGDAKQREKTKAALERVKPFLRRKIGAELRLRRVPELNFHFDEGIAHQARVEEILLDIQKERETNPYRGDEPQEGEQDSQSRAGRTESQVRRNDDESK